MGWYAFSVVALHLWNSLAVHLRAAQTVEIVKSFLKTPVFLGFYFDLSRDIVMFLLYSFCLCGSFSGQCEAFWSTMVVFKCAI